MRIRDVNKYAFKEIKDRKGYAIMNKLEEIIAASKLGELMHKKEAEEKKKSKILWILAIIGAVAAISGIAYALYRHFSPKCIEDFEDDFEDDFGDDFDDEFFEEEITE